MKIYASIHPFYRKLEWHSRKNGGGKIHEDFCPTVVANEFRSVGNVIWEVEDDENESNQTNNGMVGNGKT